MSQAIQPIAYIHTDLPEKFGVPKQSHLVPTLTGQIKFTEQFRQPDFIKGLDEFSHIWLIWGFSEIKEEPKQATVRPPRLGGNERVGVFATRSPFRPNRLGLSVVEIKAINFNGKEGPIIEVGGVDMVDGTPIYDIKPYIVYADSHPYAQSGFVDKNSLESLDVEYNTEKIVRIPENKRAALRDILAQDPRPSYHKDDKRTYGMRYEGFDVKFTVHEKTLTVNDIVSNQSRY